MQFTGSVKTTTEFPSMDHIKQHEYKEPRDHHVQHVSTPSMGNLAWHVVGVIPPESISYLLTTPSYEGNPHGKRHEIGFSGTEMCMSYTKRPKVIEDYFGSAKVVDVFNHA